MGVFTALAVAGAAAAAAGAIGSAQAGKKASDAAQTAGQIIYDAGQQGAQEFRAIREQNNDAFQPAANLLPQQVNRLSSAVQSGEFDPRNFDFQADPGFEFRRDQGQRALDNSAAARGNLLSGAQLRAGARFNQDFASNEYDRAFNRNANSLLTLYGQNRDLMNIGLQAVNQQANNRLATTQGLVNSNFAGAQGLAQGAAGAGQARAGAIQGIAGGIQQGIGSVVGAFGGFGGFGAPGAGGNPLSGVFG